MYVTDTFPGDRDLLAVERATTGPIVVATDGTEASDAALTLANSLAQKAGGTVYVVAVHQIVPPLAFELAVLPALLEVNEETREALRLQVETQVRRIAGEQHPSWTIIVRDGDPATELSKAASELSARLLVLGVQHRHLADRLFGRETALHVLEHCRVPLLVVPTGFAHLPRRALIAIDFSPPSLEAGRTALRLFDTIKEVLLMHVTPSPVPPPQMFGTWREWLDEDTTRGFEWARAGLALPEHVTVETVNRDGHAAHEIVSVARDKGVGLIVTASRGAGLLTRILTGSTARGVVHGADCAVLVVRPPAQLNVPYPILEPEHKAIPREEWMTALAQFSQRNVGRRSSMEVDDPQLGAQTQERNYFFQGAAYDPRTRQVEIMVGDFEGARRHLTRNIADVRSIHILPDATGKDWILRVAHGEGQTLLMLQR